MTIRRILLLLTLVTICADVAQAQLWVKAPEYARHGMVICADARASEIGVQVLRDGGNAVDATVATAFALAVLQPFAGNIGGGGFMLIRRNDGMAVGIDYRETAPAAAHAKMFLDDAGNLIKDRNHLGHLAVGVPGTVAGLAHAVEAYGSRPLGTLIAPALGLAENGYGITYFQEKLLRAFADKMKLFPATFRQFFKADSTVYAFGDTLRQPDLAATLRRIAANGASEFYSGQTADLIVREMERNGGLITAADLADYRVAVREPLVSQYRGFTVIGMPPPSSGGATVGLMLNMLENYDLAAFGHNSAQYIHLLAEVMRRGFATRARFLGDPDFNPEMPLQRVLSKAYAKSLARSIDLQKATSSVVTDATLGWEGSQTTHISVVDAAGNAVSNTYTLEDGFGAKVVVEGGGFLLNGEMGDFNAVPGGTDSTGIIGTVPNLIAPGKRMLSSMSPAIVTKDTSLFLVLGSPGGRTIINTVLQTILNVIDFDMNIFRAIDAPRIHHQWLPDLLIIEKWGISRDTQILLEEMGHRIKWFDTTKGRAMAIQKDPETGLLFGCADPRSSDGGAAGY